MTDEHEALVGRLESKQSGRATITVATWFSVHATHMLRWLLFWQQDGIA